ncbi:MAG TPA: SCO1664 family protein [Mycobacteriales bacterium]|nr:SCO1664 family protein [Mycobacteriales bacterium]
MTPDAAPEPAAVVAERALGLLRTGDIAIEGRLVDASNATLYCAISDAELTAACVYKPIRGERPLWDFPDGTLAYREVAAYRVSEATGWSIVPPTVLRDGPVGPGMVQLWIDVDESVDLAGLVRSRQPALRRMALFDAVVNNADRKGGHLLPLPDGHVYGVDHGVCFSVEPKLRTVLWGWRGERLDDDELFVLSDLRAQLAGQLCADLQALLAPDEVEGTVARVDALLAAGCFPYPSPDWPAIPWPPF